MTITTPAPPSSQPASHAAKDPRKEVTHMIKKIQRLFSRPQPVRDRPREFNGDLLDSHREYVFLLLHQQMRGMN